MNKIKYIILSFAGLLSCSEDNDDVLQTLAIYTQGRVFEMGVSLLVLQVIKILEKYLHFITQSRQHPI